MDGKEKDRFLSGLVVMVDDTPTRVIVMATQIPYSHYRFQVQLKEGKFVKFADCIKALIEFKNGRIIFYYFAAINTNPQSLCY